MNMALAKSGLVVLTWGNASGADRRGDDGRGVIAIKPSGVEYDKLKSDDIVIVSLASGQVLEGTKRPSSDTRTHLELYRAFAKLGGSYAVVFGTVHGASSFSGGGTVDFEGTYLPGNSPAAVSIGGPVVLGPANTLDMDIGGTTPGNAANNYAQINVTGNANLSGSLNLIPYNGFVPAAGDKFTVMTYAGA